MASTRSRRIVLGLLGIFLNSLIGKYLIIVSWFSSMKRFVKTFVSLCCSPEPAACCTAAAGASKTLTLNLTILCSLCRACTAKALCVLPKHVWTVRGRPSLGCLHVQSFPADSVFVYVRLCIMLPGLLHVFQAAATASWDVVNGVAVIVIFKGERSGSVWLKCSNKKSPGG